MRPVALHIEGFGVFREPVEISFADVDYFALVGPTGSGKSTVIDAICFALYGSVPRYGDERLVGRAVSVGKLEAKVSLTFAIGERHYRATRVVRVRDGKATTPEALLEELATEPTELSRVLAGKAREMRDAVEQLLGLPFAHFTKCVVLPQGDFARFLHDEPSKRQDLLSRLLDLEVYERIGRRARERAAGARTAIELQERQLAELAFATDDARVAATQRRDALRELFREIEAAFADDEQFAATIAESREALRATAARVELLQQVARPDDVGTHTGALATAQSAHADAEAELDAVRTALTELDAAVENLPDPTPLVRALDAHGALEAARAKTEAVVEELRAAEEALAHARTAEAEADAAAHVASEALTHARDTHAAHELALHLADGDTCPVCEQTIAHLPKRKRPAAVSGAQKALDAAQKTAANAHARATRAATQHAAVTERAAQLMAQLETLTDAILDHPDRAGVEAALANIEATRAAHEQARRREHDARERLRVAERARNEATAMVTRATEELRRQRDALLRGGLEPPTAADDLLEAWSTLVEWAEAQAASEHRAAAATQNAFEEATAARRAAVEALRARAHAVGVECEAIDLALLRDQVVEAGTRAAGLVERIDDALETASKLRVEVDQARTDCDVAELLAAQMRADRFERWLLAEALDVLVASASNVLVALSGGQYSLRYDGDEFVVVDHRNAEATRSVRTLSGGETFQASLALALALSDQLAALAAGGGTKLDAIFLDEGFGTLDADTLDVVAETIEALGTAGRMVGVVTHVPALAERVPVRYRVARTDHAATVTREDV